MDILGINLGYLLVQIFNLTVVGGWLILALFTLFRLRRQDLPETARAIWAAVILLLPLIGALAFWIVRPGDPSPEAGDR